MSYSNGLLETPNTKIIEGLPGVGFKLTKDGNYDMENKKLTNIKIRTDDDACLTKKKIYDHVKANGGGGSPVDLSYYLKRDGSVPLTGDLSMDNNKLINLKEATYNNNAVNFHQLSNTAALKADKTELTNYVKTDGSSVIKGHLLMDNNRIQNIAPPRQNSSDAVNYAYLNNFYFKYDDDNSELDCQSQVNMQNKRITNLANPRLNQADAMSYSFFTQNFVKHGYGNDIDCNGKRFYNLGSYTNNDQLITGIITEGRYLRINLATINMNAKRGTNAKTPISNNDLATKAYVDTRSSKINLSNYFLKSGDTMSGRINMSNNKIINVKNAADG